MKLLTLRLRSVLGLVRGSRGRLRPTAATLAAAGRRGGSLRLAALAGLAAATMARGARADVTSFFHAGGGVAHLRPDLPGSDDRGVLTFESGLGTDPSHPWVVGGMAKLLTFFGRGTDMALSVRLASGGFARGGFGFAVDAGGYYRRWGAESVGGIGALVLGAPLGLQLTGFGQIGSADVQTVGVTLGIDFLRLSVQRETLLEYWQNPQIVPR